MVVCGLGLLMETHAPAAVEGLCWVVAAAVVVVLVVVVMVVGGRHGDHGQEPSRLEMGLGLGLVAPCLIYGSGMSMEQLCACRLPETACVCMLVWERIVDGF